MNVSAMSALHRQAQSGRPLPTREHAHDRLNPARGTLGQRLEEAVRNGGIRREALGRALAGAASLPQERIQDVKAAFDRGETARALGRLHDLRPHGEGAGGIDTLA